MWVGGSQVENFPGSYGGHRGKPAVMNRLRFGSEAPLLAPGEKHLSRWNLREKKQNQGPAGQFFISSVFTSQFTRKISFCCCHLVFIPFMFSVS